MNLSPALIPFEYEYKPGLYLGASSFNPLWVHELGLKPEGLILDIGSYDGGDAVRFKREFPECSVFSFEINEDRYDKITKNINEDGVEFRNYAISDITGYIDYNVYNCNLKDAGSLHNPGDIGGQCSIFNHTHFYNKTYPHISFKEIEEAISYRIHDLFPCENILLAHIDVEGAELNVLKGMGDLRPKLIYIETLEGMFEGAASKEDIHSYLTSINYSLIKDCVSDRLYLFNL